MNDRININVDVLSSCESSFMNEKRNFETDEKKFLSSKFYHDTNETICKMKTEMLQKFNSVGFAYENILKWWNNYLTDVSDLESTLAGDMTGLNAPITSVDDAVDKYRNIKDKIEEFKRSVLLSTDKINTSTKGIGKFPPSVSDYLSNKYKGNIEKVLNAKMNPGIEYYQKSWDKLVHAVKPSKTVTGAKNMNLMKTDPTHIATLATVSALTSASPNNFLEQMKIITEGKKIKKVNNESSTLDTVKKANSIIHDNKKNNDTSSVIVTHGTAVDITDWNFKELEG